MPIQLYVLLLHQMEHPHLCMLCSIQASCTKHMEKYGHDVMKDPTRAFICNEWVRFTLRFIEQSERRRLWDGDWYAIKHLEAAVANRATFAVLARSLKKQESLKTANIPESIRTGYLRISTELPLHQLCGDSKRTHESHDRQLADQVYKPRPSARYKQMFHCFIF